VIGDSEKQRPHARLDVWRDAMDLVVLVYAHASRLPDTERYGLSAQLRRAAVSRTSPRVLPADPRQNWFDSC